MSGCGCARIGCSTQQGGLWIEKGPRRAGASGTTDLAGDSLSKTAKELLGDADLWPEISAVNKDRIDDANAIEPGLKLRIPS